MESLRTFDLGGCTVDFGPDKRDGASSVFLTMIARDGKLVEGTAVGGAPVPAAFKQ